MSVVLAEAPTAAPATREERLSAALDGFALGAGARAAVLADADGLPCAACAGTDTEHAELWAAAAARALDAASAIQGISRRFGPVEASVALDGELRLYARQLRAPDGPVLAVVIGPRSPGHEALVQLERAVAETLGHH